MAVGCEDCSMKVPPPSPSAVVRSLHQDASQCMTRVAGVGAKDWRHCVHWQSSFVSCCECFLGARREAVGQCKQRRVFAEARDVVAVVLMPLQVTVASDGALCVWNFYLA